MALGAIRPMPRIHTLHPYLNKPYYKIYLDVIEKNSKSLNPL